MRFLIPIVLGLLALFCAPTIAGLNHSLSPNCPYGTGFADNCNSYTTGSVKYSLSSLKQSGQVYGNTNSDGNHQGCQATAQNGLTINGGGGATAGCHPPWNLWGVEAGVGVPVGTTLLDPKTHVPSGCLWADGEGGNPYTGGGAVANSGASGAINGQWGAHGNPYANSLRCGVDSLGRANNSTFTVQNLEFDAIGGHGCTFLEISTGTSTAPGSFGWWGRDYSFATPEPTGTITLSHWGLTDPNCGAYGGSEALIYVGQSIRSNGLINTSFVPIVLTGGSGYGAPGTVTLTYTAGACPGSQPTFTATVAGGAVVSAVTTGGSCYSLGPDNVGMQNTANWSCAAGTTTCGSGTTLFFEYSGAILNITKNTFDGTAGSVIGGARPFAWWVQGTSGAVVNETNNAYINMLGHAHATLVCCNSSLDLYEFGNLTVGFDTACMSHSEAIADLAGIFVRKFNTVVNTNIQCAEAGDAFDYFGVSSAPNEPTFSLDVENNTYISNTSGGGAVWTDTLYIKKTSGVLSFGSATINPGSYHFPYGAGVGFKNILTGIKTAISNLSGSAATYCNVQAPGVVCQFSSTGGTGNNNDANGNDTSTYPATRFMTATATAGIGSNVLVISSVGATNTGCVNAAGTTQTCDSGTVNLGDTVGGNRVTPFALSPPFLVTPAQIIGFVGASPTIGAAGTGVYGALPVFTFSSAICNPGTPASTWSVTATAGGTGVTTPVASAGYCTTIPTSGQMTTAGNWTCSANCGTGAGATFGATWPVASGSDFTTGSYYLNTTQTAGFTSASTLTSSGVASGNFYSVQFTNYWGTNLIDIGHLQSKGPITIKNNYFDITGVGGAIWVADAHCSVPVSFSGNVLMTSGSTNGSSTPSNDNANNWWFANGSTGC